MKTRLHWKIEDDVRPLIVSLVNRVNPNSVLDIGCGNGRYTEILSNKGQRRYLGIDIDDKKLRIAERHFPYARFIEADFFSYELNETFDLAFTCCFICLPCVKTKVSLVARKVNSITTFFLCIEGYLGMEQVIPNIFQDNGFKLIFSQRFTQHSFDIFLFRVLGEVDFE